jgi:hypothetical protein
MYAELDAISDNSIIQQCIYRSILSIIICRSTSEVLLAIHHLRFRIELEKSNHRQETLSN